MQPDLRPRLPAATGIDEVMLDVLQAQADALKGWLMAHGYTKIQCEVPIQKREASGAEFNGVIDLLAEGAEKSLILDHKSGFGFFSDYATQLEAYRTFLIEAESIKKFDMGIHWVDRGTVELEK